MEERILQPCRLCLRWPLAQGSLAGHLRKALFRPAKPIIPLSRLAIHRTQVTIHSPTHPPCRGRPAGSQKGQGRPQQICFLPSRKTTCTRTTIDALAYSRIIFTVLEITIDLAVKVWLHRAGKWTRPQKASGSSLSSYFLLCRPD